MVVYWTVVCFQLPTTQAAEHLVHSVQVNSSAQELARTLNTDPSSCHLDPRLIEYRLELDRVQSRADHLRAQNDTLALTLAESKVGQVFTALAFLKCEFQHSLLECRQLMHNL